MANPEILTMTNEELVTAIQAAKDLVYTISTSNTIYNATCDHYKALLKEQQRRAEARKAIKNA